MTRKDKIQHLLITYLLQEGEIELALPDGLRLELGITRENRHGDLEKCSDYCWLVASQQKRSVTMDAYNLGLKFYEDKNRILVEDNSVDHDGGPVQLFDFA